MVCCILGNSLFLLCKKGGNWKINKNLSEAPQIN